MKRLTIIASYFVLLATFELHAQETVLVTGGDATGSGGTFSYSVGQVVYTENASVSDGSIILGVQFPFEIYNESALGINELSDINLTIKAYPNPTASKLFLFVKHPYPTNFKYQLYDVTGRLLISKLVSTQETLISMEGFPVAIYTLVVISNNRLIRMFKIIKK